MRLRYLPVLIALIAAAPMRALAAPADLDAAQKLTREACEAIVHQDVQPLLELIRNGDIRSELLQRMPEGYPSDPEEREKIAAAFMERLETDLTKILSSAAGAELYLPSPREDKDSLVVPVRFDCGSAQKTRFTIFQIFRYRTSPEGPRLVNMETPLAGRDLVSGTASLMPPHWPELAEDKEKLRQKAQVILAMLRGSHVEAEKAAREALKESPDDMVFRLALSGALVSIKKYEDAKALYNDMLARGQAVLFAHNQLATLAVEQQNYDEAIAHLRIVQEGLGEDDCILAQIANAQRLAGKTAEAKTTLDRALQISPFSLHALEQRARLRIGQGDLDGAADDLRLVKTHHGLGVLTLLKDPEFSKLVLMEKYGDLIDRTPEPKAP
jgi:tetratricopeptide (TPR) repeat protein